jgi:hypothetical protein
MASLDWEKRRRKQIVDERGPLPWWWRSWGRTTRVEKSTPAAAAAKPVVPRKRPARKRRANRGDAVAQSRAATSDSRRRRAGKGDTHKHGFVSGATFTYRNSRGEVTRHTIVRVSRARVYTSDGKEWKLSTLEKIGQGPNPTVTLV